jgi:hypothetical protein
MRAHADTLFVGAPILKGFDDDLEAFRLGLLHGLLLRKDV